MHPVFFVDDRDAARVGDTVIALLTRECEDIGDIRAGRPALNVDSTNVAGVE